MKNQYSKYKLLILHVCSVGLFACSADNNWLNEADDWWVATRKAKCERDARCGGISHSNLINCVGDAEARSTIYPVQYSLNNATKEQRVTMDRLMAIFCIDSLRHAGCTQEEYNDVLSKQCDLFRIFSPKRAIGASCFSSLECINGFCAGKNGPLLDGCAGTCEQYHNEMEPCNPDKPSSCQPHLYCARDIQLCTMRSSDGARCVGNESCGNGLVCKGYVAPGNNIPERLGTCSSRNRAQEVCLVNSNCKDSNDCPSGSFCAGYRPSRVAVSIQYGTCSPAGQIGETCSIMNNTLFDCMPGLFCDISMMTPRCINRTGEGMPCNDLRQCQDGLVCAGLIQQQGRIISPGQCVPYLDYYDDCSGNDSTFASGGGAKGAARSACPNDTFCPSVVDVRVCTPLSPPGGFCDFDCKTGEPDSFFHCGNDYYCNNSTSRCTQRLPVGSACNPSRQLEPVCADGICSASGICVHVCE